jgi:uncharacterized metal-binding protein
MAENQGNTCACSGAPTLIFACSGAADVGAVTDQAARGLTREGAGKMYCLAGIGGRVSGILATTATAGKILVLDGCALDCAKNTLEQAGFNASAHVRLTDLGFEKGKSPANAEDIARVMDAGRAALDAVPGLCA